MRELSSNKLKGVILDLAVAMATGITDGKIISICDGNIICQGKYVGGPMLCEEAAFDECINKWKFSTNWGIGGPLIGMHQINIEYIEPKLVVASIIVEKDGDRWFVDCEGTTALEAAMRCIVVKAFGNTVLVPDMLVESKIMDDCYED